MYLKVFPFKSKASSCFRNIIFGILSFIKAPAPMKHIILMKKTKKYKTKYPKTGFFDSKTQTLGSYFQN